MFANQGYWFEPILLAWLPVPDTTRHDNPGVPPGPAKPEVLGFVSLGRSLTYSDKSTALTDVFDVGRHFPTIAGCHASLSRTERFSDDLEAVM